MSDGSSLEPVDSKAGVLIDGKYKLNYLYNVDPAGHAYMATHIHLGKNTPIKLMNSTFIRNLFNEELFNLAAKKIMYLNHPYIVNILDYKFTSEDLNYFVIESVTAIGFQGLMEKKYLFDIPRALKLTKQVCSVLQEAHKQNFLVYLSPTTINISNFETSLEQIKINFDLCSVIKSCIPIAELPNIKSPHCDFTYSASEIAEKELSQNISPFDPRSDIYSIGCFFYHILTGSPPFNGTSQQTLGLKHIHARPQNLREINPAIPQELDDLVFKLLAKKPSDRVQTVGEIIEALDRIKNHL